MILPLTFSNVTYQVAGSSKYRGDLIVTQGVIYYFPHTDAANRRFTVIVKILLIVLGPFLALTVMYLLYAGLHIVAIFAGVLLVLGISFVSFTQGLVVEMVSSVVKQAWEIISEPRKRPIDIPEQDDKMAPPETDALQQPLNLYPITLSPALWHSLMLQSAFLVLKEDRSGIRDSLPAPTRFTKNRICRLSLSVTGILTVETEFDMKNNFHTDISSQEDLRTALKKGGFIS